MCTTERVIAVAVPVLVAFWLVAGGGADAAPIIVDTGLVPTDPGRFPLPLSQYTSEYGTGFKPAEFKTVDVELVALQLRSVDPRRGVPVPSVGEGFPADSFFDVFVEIDLPGLYAGDPPFVASFFDVFVEMDVKGPSVPGDTIKTEMVSLNLPGKIPGGPTVGIRESPDLASTGRHGVTDLGGGLYEIDSFFDVFVELSVDGGETWHPAERSIHMTLSIIPEPSTLSLLGLGALGLLVRRRKRR